MRVGDVMDADIAWSHPAPFREAPRIVRLVACFNERVDLAVEGEPARARRSLASL